MRSYRFDAEKAVRDYGTVGVGYFRVPWCDDRRLHDAGSLIVTLALLPLAASIACDMWVALYKVTGKEVLPTVGAL